MGILCYVYRIKTKKIYISHNYGTIRRNTVSDAKIPIVSVINNVSHHQPPLNPLLNLNGYSVVVLGTPLQLCGYGIKH